MSLASARRTEASTDASEPLSALSGGGLAPAYQLSLGAGSSRRASIAGAKISNQRRMPSALGWSASRMREGRMAERSSVRNAAEQSTNPTCPPLPRASEAKRALTSAMASEYTPG